MEGCAMKIPAFIDSHLHFLGIGYYQDIIDLKDSLSVFDILKKLSRSNREIIIARGYNQDKFKNKTMIEKKDLATIAKPVCIFRVCGHVAILNQAMLDYLDFTENTKVSGGTIDYKRGIITENALNLLQEALPKPTIEDLKRYIINANNLLLSQGITKVASDDFSSFALPFEQVIQAYNEVDEQGLLQVEVTEQVNLSLSELKRFKEKGLINKRYNHLKMGPLKVLTDGSLGGRTASLNEPYSDDNNNFGVLTYKDQDLQELVDFASANDMDSVLHAIGDKACDQVIKILINTQNRYSGKRHNNAIIHAQLLNRKQIDLMKKHSIKAIIQPIFINTDLLIIDGRIGRRRSDSYLFKTMNENLHVGFSTDSPVETVNPFHNLYCALTQKSIDYPNLKPLNNSECFTLKDALKAYTTNNLDFVYDQDHSDYIEIDRDIYNIDFSDLKATNVLKVYRNNKIIYSK